MYSLLRQHRGRVSTNASYEDKRSDARVARLLVPRAPCAVPLKIPGYCLLRVHMDEDIPEGGRARGS
jgi:hypothetical protein